MNYWHRRKQRKRLEALVHQARSLRNMREHVLGVEELEALDAALAAARSACRSHDAQLMVAADDALAERIQALTPPCSHPDWRENFEVLVVALGVAMAFRAYFYQPFQIPTGSMQPTLYGICSHEQPAPRTCDKPFLKLPNWLISGEWFSRMQTKQAGKLAVLWGDDRVPGYMTVVSGRWPGELPPEDFYRRESWVGQKLHTLFRSVGVGVLDRGYDLFFLPNDLASRHAGIFQNAYVPPPAVQAQVIETLRKHQLWLSAGGNAAADVDTRKLALTHVYPLVATLANWSRGGLLEEDALQALMHAYGVCEALRRGRLVDPAQEQQTCAALAKLVGGWSDALSAGSPGMPWFPLVSGCGVELPAGQLLWSGVVTEGDFVFVNRWLWNFRLPQRGEVMVFSTSGIPTLPQGTHYIKRMCGLPSELLSIHPPEFWIDGKPVLQPHAIARVARQEKLAEWAPPYAGYRVAGENLDPLRFPRALRSSADCIQLKSNEYFAMGDNTPNSLDGRYWGPVPRQNLLGPASVVYWPFTSKRWGWIE